MRSFCSSLRLLGLAAGLAALVSCSTERTAHNGDPSFATTQVLSISGPLAVTQAAYKMYTWRAYMGAPYASFHHWGVRICPTAKTALCTSPWATYHGTNGPVGSNTNFLTLGYAENCGGGHTRVVQLRAQRPVG